MASRRLRASNLSNRDEFEAGYNLWTYCYLAYFLYTLCVPSMGIWYRRYQIIPEGESPLRASWWSSLASDKLVHREVSSEGSECWRIGTASFRTAKSGTDELKILIICVSTGTVYRGQVGRVSKHIFVMPVTNNPYWVDAAGIGGRNMSLPGEISDCTSCSLRSQQKP